MVDNLSIKLLFTTIIRCNIFAVAFDRKAACPLFRFLRKARRFLRRVKELTKHPPGRDGAFVYFTKMKNVIKEIEKNEKSDRHQHPGKLLSRRGGRGRQTAL